MVAVLSKMYTNDDVNAATSTRRASAGSSKWVARKKTPMLSTAARKKTANMANSHLSSSVKYGSVGRRSVMDIRNATTVKMSVTTNAIRSECADGCIT